jgi:HEPN domain-containing protein
MPVVTKHVADWLHLADDDLDTVALLIREGGSPRAACFHSQQAAEKSLKGFLAFRQKPSRKIHELDKLLEECLKIDSKFTDLRDDAIFLTQFYTDTRYVADLPDLSQTIAYRALAAAKHVRGFVGERIRT